MRMPRLSLFLLGPPQIECDGLPVKVETRKAVALLTFLAVTKQVHRRDELATLLWPDFGQRRGRTILRYILYALRQSLGSSWLEVNREDVGLRQDAGL